MVSSGWARALAKWCSDTLSGRTLSTRHALPVGLAGALATIGLRYLLQPELGGSESLLSLFPVVLLTTLVAGAPAGWICLCAALIAAWYLFLGTPFSFVLAPLEANSLVSAFVFGAIVVGVAATLRTSLRALETAKGRETLLVNELQHRVRNNIMLVMSISRRTYRPGVPLAAAQAEFEARLQALADVHEAIGKTDAGMVDMRSIATRCLLPFGTDSHAGQIELSGPDLQLKPRAAVAFSLALHELATNAAKYGALSTPAGQVRLRWSREDGGAIHLHWRESGGPHVYMPVRRGFGSQLIERNVAAELGGSAKMIFHPEGLQVDLIARSGAA